MNVKATYKRLWNDHDASAFNERIGKNQLNGFQIRRKINLLFNAFFLTSGSCEVVNFDENH